VLTTFAQLLQNKTFGENAMGSSFFTVFLILVLPNSTVATHVDARQQWNQTTDAQNESLLEDEIQQIEKIIKKKRKDNDKADLYFRLAERYHEKARMIYYREMQEYDQSIQAWLESPGKNTNRSEPKLNDRASRKALQHALDTYQLILDEYPDYQRRDEVVFSLGYNLKESDRGSEALSHYKTLIKKYPTSKFVPDAYLSIGEYYFNAKYISKALKAYSEAEKFHESKASIYASYKLGWCEYNLGHFKKALQKFKQVIEEDADGKTASPHKATGKSRRWIQLRNEALNDLVLTYTRLEAVESVFSYFQSQLGKKKSFRYLKLLSEHYQNQGQSALTIKACRNLLNEYPQHASNPQIHNAIVSAYRKENEKRKVVREIRRMLSQYGKGSTWRETNKLDPVSISKADEILETTLRDVATDCHVEAQTTKDFQTYRQLRALYELYFPVFSESPHSKRMRWYYSDVLYKMGDYAQAAKNYSSLAESTTKKYTSESAYNAVLCWEKCVEIKRTKSVDCRDAAYRNALSVIDKSHKWKELDLAFLNARTPEGSKKEKIPELEKNFILASDRFVDLAPQHDMLVPVLYKSAYIDYQYNHFLSMTKRLHQIIERHPKNPYAVRAVHLSLNCLLARAKDTSLSPDQRTSAWKEISQWSSSFLQNKELIDSANAREEKLEMALKEISDEAVFNLLLAEKDRSPVLAANGFVAYAKSKPKGKFAHRALYAALVLFHDTKMIRKAIRVGKKLVKDYPKSDRIPSTASFLAALCQNVADFNAAAKYHELFYATWVDQGAEPRAATDASRALYNATVLRLSLGQGTPLTKNIRNYIKHFPDEVRAKELLLVLGEHYQKHEKWLPADIVFKGFLQKFAEEANAQQILRAYEGRLISLHALGKRKDRNLLMEKIMALDEDAAGRETNNRSWKSLLAHARFDSSEEEYKEYTQIKLELPIKRLRKNLLLKLAKKSQLEQVLYSTMENKVPTWTLAALVRSGQMDMHLADAMLQAPVPPELTEQQADIYMEALQKQALPLEEKAKETFEQAVRFSRQHKLYNKWTMLAQELLNVYKTDSFPPVFIMDLRSSGSMVPSLEYRFAPLGQTKSVLVNAKD
jgi:TolA-binding protein